MTIKIIACAKPNYWYADVVGSEFENAVKEGSYRDADGNWVKAPSGHILLPDISRKVFEGDYEIVNN